MPDLIKQWTTKVGIEARITRSDALVYCLKIQPLPGTRFKRPADKEGFVSPIYDYANTVEQAERLAEKTAEIYLQIRITGENPQEER